MSTAVHPETSDLRSVDRQLLLALRGGDAFGVGELTAALGVTATAVRQRIERLLEQGLIEREKLVSGRGRPTFRYRLTVVGHQRAGANPTELADAMWREILAYPDEQVRDRLLESIAARLGRQFAVEVLQIESDDQRLESVDRDTMADSLREAGESCDAQSPSTFFDNANGSTSSSAECERLSADEDFEARIRRLSRVLASRQIDTEVSQSGNLPVLDIGSCPYPALTDASADRAMCRLEEKIFSEALGRPVHLSSCRLDGDACCQFAAVDAVAGANSLAESAVTEGAKS